VQSTFAWQDGEKTPHFSTTYVEKVLQQWLSGSTHASVETEC